MDEVFKQLQDLQTASATALDYAKTLVLLRALKAGTVKLDNVEMTPNGWQLTQPTKTPQAVWVAPPDEEAEPEAVETITATGIE